MQERRRDILLYVENQAVFHITNYFFSSSRAMMTELRLKRVLDRSGPRIRTEWIPSVANKFADALSQRLPRGDLRIQRLQRRSVVASMGAPIDAFPYRPLEEHPVFLRRQAWAELESQWDCKQVRLLCPPVDMIMPTLLKLTPTKAPAYLQIQKFPRQSLFARAVALASRTPELQNPPNAV